MRISHFLVRVALAATMLVLTSTAYAADPTPAASRAQPRLSDEEYERRIEELENSIKELRKDTRQLEVANEEEQKLKPIAGWDRGFFIQSPDGANKLTVGGYIHFDGRFFTNPNDKAVSQFLLRRARIDLRGKFLKYFEFRFLPDFAGGQVVIQDAYLNVNYVPWARVQVGKYKGPVGLERLQSANAIMFVERAQPTNLVPNRDLGLMLWGQPFYGAIEYELGIFNGPPDGASENFDSDFNSDKDFEGRVFLLPFKDTPYEFLRGFGVGIAGTYGNQIGSLSNTQLPAYKTNGQQTYFSYVTNSPSTTGGTAIANGAHTRIAPQGYWYWGPAGFLWEWVESNNGVQLGNAPSNNIQAQAWQTALSYVVTGEPNGYRGIIPARNFDPWNLLDGAWGALELVARYDQMSIDKAVYTLGYADPTKSARQAFEWGLGANWYVNQMVRIMLDFNQTSFTNGAKNNNNRPVEDVIESRVQFVF